jgi:hypothetical protein
LNDFSEALLCVKECVRNFRMYGVLAPSQVSISLDIMLGEEKPSSLLPWSSPTKHTPHNRTDMAIRGEKTETCLVGELGWSEEDGMFGV